MKLVVRIIQALFALAILNAAYGMALLLGLSSVYGNGKRTSWDILGSVVSMAVYAIVIVLLQRYLEYKSGAKVISSRKYFGMTIAGISIVAIVGLAVVASIVVLAFAQSTG